MSSSKLTRRVSCCSRYGWRRLINWPNCSGYIVGKSCENLVPCRANASNTSQRERSKSSRAFVTKMTSIAPTSLSPWPTNACEKQEQLWEWNPLHMSIQPERNSNSIKCNIIHYDNCNLLYFSPKNQNITSYEKLENKSQFKAFAIKIVKGREREHNMRAYICEESNEGTEVSSGSDYKYRSNPWW